MGYYKWADKAIGDLKSKIPTYTRSQFPAKRLGMATSFLNSRMPGSDQYARNILSNQAGQISNINRNATDASQALALSAATQGQTDESFGALQGQEAEWKRFGLGNLNQAYESMQQEDMNVYQGGVRSFEDLVSLTGAQAANKLAKRKALWNTVGGIANLGVSLFTGGMGGGLFGKGGGGASGGGDKAFPGG